MTVVIDGGAGVTFPDTVQQTNATTNTGGSARYYAARAWVTFDGTTTPPTILSQANVASVARNSTGIYTITFTSPMPSANYSAVFSGNSTFSGGYQPTIMVVASPAPTASSFRILNSNPSVGGENNARISVVVFG